jgi:asparagine synthase (glutamine-hydrolysing)
MGNVRGLHEHQWSDLRRWSLPVLLRYQDRNSMAHSIEARVPMVDHRFVELALTLPEQFFFQQGMTKRLLVEALGDRLPESLQRRRTKLGFDTPQATWMSGPLGAALEARVRNCTALDAVLHRRQCCQAFVQYRQGRRQIPHFTLFRIACLAIWLDRFGAQPY